MEQFARLTSGIIVLAWCIASQGLSAESTAAVLSPEGYGPVRIGMPLDVAMKTLGADWSYEAVNAIANGDEGDCGYLQTAEDAPVQFMVADGKVVRVEATAPSALTAAGIHLGSTEQEVRGAYAGNVMEQAHFYRGRPALYLDVWAAGGPNQPNGDVDQNARGLRFETNSNRQVDRIYGGGPAIQYVEGCL